MSLTIAQIAAKALNAAQGAITDAVPFATITRTVQGVYDAVADAYAVTTTTQTGRGVFTSTSAAQDAFPQFVVGANDQAIMLEGFTAIAENDVLVINGVSRTIMAVQDIGGAGTLFQVIAR